MRSDSDLDLRQSFSSFFFSLVEPRDTGTGVRDGGRLPLCPVPRSLPEGRVSPLDWSRDRIPGSDVTPKPLFLPLRSPSRLRPSDPSGPRLWVFVADLGSRSVGLEGPESTRTGSRPLGTVLGTTRNTETYTTGPLRDIFRSKGSKLELFDRCTPGFG